MTPTRKNPLGIVWVRGLTFAAALEEQMSIVARDVNHSVICPVQRAHELAPAHQAGGFSHCAVLKDGLVAAPAEGLLSGSIFPSRILQGSAVQDKL